MHSQMKEKREQLAMTFANLLSEKNLEWKKGWNISSIHPKNAMTNRGYNGINTFALSLSSIIHGYGDFRWATFVQIKENGWKLSKGSKGESVEYWFPIDISTGKSVPWEDYFKIRHENDNLRLTAKYFTVFNGDCIDGLPPMPKLDVYDIIQDEVVSKLSHSMGVEILHDGGENAFYRLLDDKIHLPLKRFFFSNYEYNSTALHELAHATGHQTRLNRKMEHSNYAFEELVAEISSCFMGITLQETLDESYINNHKAYVQGWISAIREKPESLIKAIAEAEKVANYMDFHLGIISSQEYLQTQRKCFSASSDKVEGQDSKKSFDLFRDFPRVEEKVCHCSNLAGYTSKTIKQTVPQIDWDSWENKM